MMAEFEIPISSLTSLRDKVVLITGASSGIGKAAVLLALQLGAKVIAGDLNTLPDDFLQELQQEQEQPNQTKSAEKSLFFAQTDVTDWSSLQNLFVKGIQRFGRIDHVFANAGIGPRTNFLEETFEEGAGESGEGLLAPPNLKVIDVNLVSVISTVRLGVYYLRKSGNDHGQEREETSPSITVTASASSFQDFGAPDYTIAKHGVLGILRGLYTDLQNSNSSTLQPSQRRPVVRLNAISPSWTNTGLVPTKLFESWGVQVQEAEAVARSVTKLFTDASRQGELVYSREGRFCEMNRAEGGLLDAVARIPAVVTDEGAILERMKRLDGVVMQ